MTFKKNDTNSNLMQLIFDRYYLKGFACLSYAISKIHFFKEGATIIDALWIRKQSMEKLHDFFEKLFSLVAGLLTQGIWFLSSRL